MKVVWQVDDGYAGGGRPQHLTIPNEEFAECETEEECQQLIEDYVQSDFENKISWRIVSVEE